MRSFRFAVVAISLLLCLSIITAGAQDKKEWTSPEDLSKTVLNDTGQAVSTLSPILVADQWGNTHAIFAANIDTGEDASYDTLYYSRFDGDQWTRPNAVLYKRASNFWKTQMTVDSAGWLHLVWIDGPTAMYSRVFADKADTAASWSKPVRVGDDTIRNASIVAGLDGFVHLVYCSSEEAGYIAHTKTGNGYDWSLPIEIATVGGCWARAAEDGTGRLHVVYSEQPGASAGTAVYYSHSLDGGSSWSSPLELDSKNENYLANYGPSWVNVATVGLDEIHVVWDGAPAGQRWHQWSADGGVTWSESEQIASLHRGLTEPNALAVDSSGRVHMISLGWLDTDDNPNRPFYASWLDDQWSSLDYIGERSDWDSEGGSATIFGGNILIAGWRHQTGEGNEVWVANLEVDSPGIPPEISPTLLPSLDPRESPVPVEPMPESSTKVTPEALFAEDRPPTSISSSKTIFAAAGLVLFLLAILVFAQLKRRPRSF